MTSLATLWTGAGRIWCTSSSWLTTPLSWPPSSGPSPLRYFLSFFPECFIHKTLRWKKENIENTVIKLKHESTVPHITISYCTVYTFLQRLCKWLWFLICLLVFDFVLDTACKIIFSNNYEKWKSQMKRLWGCMRCHWHSSQNITLHAQSTNDPSVPGSL
jgi:hypothetical protein